MKQKMSKKTIMTLLMAMVFSFTTIVGAIVVSFSIWSGNKQSVPVVSEDFNASEDDFTFYAAIENIANDGGYDYYPLDSVPEDLSSLIKGHGNEEDPEVKSAVEEEMKNHPVREEIKNE